MNVEMNTDAISSLQLMTNTLNNITALYQGAIDDLVAAIRTQRDRNANHVNSLEDEIKRLDDEAIAKDLIIKKLSKQSDAPSWIPVDEEFPLPDTTVLVSVSGSYGKDVWEHAFFFGAIDDEGRWYIMDDFEPYCFYVDEKHLTVEAWMPLPDEYDPEKDVARLPTAADNADK